MTAFVLTRTSRRPRAFARLRADLLAQEFAGSIVHVVHSDDPADAYVEGDIVVRSPRAKARRPGDFPWDQYHLAMLRAVQADGREGVVTFMDDDDTYASPHALARMLQHAAPGVMPIWRVERERGRISPATWQADLASPEGRICWEASALHTSSIPLALAIGIDERDGADGRFWAALAQQHQLVWLDDVLARPQAGKGKGRRHDVP